MSHHPATPAPFVILKIYFTFNYGYVCYYAEVCPSVYADIQKDQDIRALGAGVIYGCELASIDAEN